jgi:23S rRNA pseudouridine2605 synthase
VVEVRLQKLLSRAGLASRREAEALMLQGRVRVNGRVVTTLGTRVDPVRDRVELDGRRVETGEARWIAFHKPVGVLTSRGDPRGRATVYQRLPAELGVLRYVGRLDRDTEGLLLLSNDGDWIHRVLHPSSRVEREYEAEVVGEPDRAVLTRLTGGVELEDGPARALAARKAGSARCEGCWTPSDTRWSVWFACASARSGWAICPPGRGASWTRTRFGR